MIVSPSILSADFSHLLEEVLDVEKHGATFLHIDVMDGHFVPNITIGPTVLKSLQGKTKMVMDTHLMITDPLKYAQEFKKAGSDYITFHYEAVDDVELTIKEIKKLGVKVGISIKPNTSVEVLDKYLDILDLVLVMSVEPGFGGQKFMENSLAKIEYLANKKKEYNYSYLIEVDGGIDLNTAPLCKEKGCEVVVAGTAVFKANDRKQVIEGLLKL